MTVNSDIIYPRTSCGEYPQPENPQTRGEVYAIIMLR
jgi:hypothetical protein